MKSRKFTPNFDAIQNDASVTEASAFARRLLIDYVRQYAQFEGVTQTELARRTGFHQSHVARFFSAKYSPNMDTFLKIAGALGLHLDLSPQGSAAVFPKRKSGIADAG